MPNREIHHNTLEKLLLATATVSSAQTSATLDTQDSDAAFFTIHHGATMAAGGAYVVNESDNASTWTAAPATSVIDDGGALAASTGKRVSYVGNKRYTQLVYTPGGSTIVTITGTLGYPSQAPYANPA